MGKWFGDTGLKMLPLAISKTLAIACIVIMLMCNTKFDPNGRPPEEFTAHLCNRECDKFQVWARIECDETKHSELYRMVQSDQSNAEFVIEEPVRCNQKDFLHFLQF